MMAQMLSKSRHCIFVLCCTVLVAVSCRYAAGAPVADSSSRQNDGRYIAAADATSNNEPDDSVGLDNDSASYIDEDSSSDADQLESTSTEAPFPPPPPLESAQTQAQFEQEEEETGQTTPGEQPQSRSLVPTSVAPTPTSQTLLNPTTKLPISSPAVSYVDYLGLPISNGNDQIQQKPLKFNDNVAALAALQQQQQQQQQERQVLKSQLEIKTSNTLPVSIAPQPNAPQIIPESAPPLPLPRSLPPQPVAAADSMYNAVSYGDGPLTYQVPVYVHKDNNDDAYRVLLEQFQKKVTSQSGEIVETTGMVVKNALITQELAHSKMDQLLPYLLALGTMFAFSPRNS